MHPVRQRAYLDGALAGDVIGANGQAGLACAEHARASAEMRLFVLLVHGSHAPGGEDVAHMDQAIQHLCGGFHHLVLLLREGVIVWGVRVQNHIQRKVIVGHLQVWGDFELQAECIPCEEATQRHRQS